MNQFFWFVQPEVTLNYLLELSFLMIKMKAHFQRKIGHSVNIGVTLHIN